MEEGTPQSRHPYSVMGLIKATSFLVLTVSAEYSIRFGRVSMVGVGIWTADNNTMVQ